MPWAKGLRYRWTPGGMLICNSAGWRHRPIGSPQAIVLLDEATSALDAITAAQVHRQLAALRCTRIVIAHRLHTMRDADLILVLEDGAIVERGAHAALLTQRGHYAALVQSQMEIDAVAATIPVIANGTH
jgi:ABC-type transport system involved in cytochrome bd biosynthesis fused ATPase/permease subunit